MQPGRELTQHERGGEQVCIERRQPVEIGDRETAGQRSVARGEFARDRRIRDGRDGRDPVLVRAARRADERRDGGRQRTAYARHTRHQRRAVRQRDGAPAIGDVVGRARHGDRRLRFQREDLRGVERGVGGGGAVHAAPARRAARQADDLRCVAANHGRMRIEQIERERGAKRERADRDRIEHPRFAGVVGGIDGSADRLALRQIERTEIHRYRVGQRHEFAHFLAGDDHGGRGAQRKQHVRREVRDNEIRQAVDERCVLTHARRKRMEIGGEHGRGRKRRRSTRRRG